MQQFTVPQFIDVEDKIFGPITTRQFIIMLVCFIIIAIGYKILVFTWFVIFGLFTFGVSGVIAFLRINGMPFHFFMLNFTQTMLRPKKRVWNKTEEEAIEVFEIEVKKKGEDHIIVPRKEYSMSKLSELSLIVDTQGSYKGEDEQQFKPKIETKKSLR